MVQSPIHNRYTGHSHIKILYCLLLLTLPRPNVHRTMCACPVDTTFFCIITRHRKELLRNRSCSFFVLVQIQGLRTQALPNPHCDSCFLVEMDTQVPHPRIKEKNTHATMPGEETHGRHPHVELNENAKTTTQDAGSRCCRATKSRRRGNASSIGGYFVLRMVFRVNIKENRSCAGENLS